MKNVINKILRVLGEWIFLILLLPALVIASSFYIQTLTDNFWMNLLAIFLFSGVATIVSVKGGNISTVFDDWGLAEFRGGLRNLLVFCVGGVLMMRISNTNNLETQDFGIVPVIVLVALAVIILAYVVVPSLGNLIQSIRPGYLFPRKKFAKSFKLIILFSFGMMCLSQMYINFGTLYVWVPSILMISLPIFTTLLKDNPFDWFWRGTTTKDFLESYIILSVPVALISTLYQFWFTEIVLGFVLWNVLLGVIIVLVIVALVVLCVNKIRGYRRNRSIEKAKQEKERKETQEKEQKAREQKEAQILSQKKADEAKKAWNSYFEKRGGKNFDSPDTLIRALNFFPNDFSKESFWFDARFDFPLVDILSVSVLKKKIVFDGEATRILEFVGRLGSKTQDDHQIEHLLNLLGGLEKSLEGKEDYLGYFPLEDLIGENFKDLIEVRSKLKS